MSRGPESQLQSKCLEWLRARHVYALNLFGDGMSGKGKPDIIACVDGRFVALELKVGDNRMSDAQVIHMRRILASGGEHYEIRSVAELADAIEGRWK